MNFAQKVGIVVASTALTFAIGIAACSPLAPSVEKNKLSRPGQPGTLPDGHTNPIPNGLHMLFLRDKSANILVGQEAFDWFFNTRPKNVKDLVVSGESLPQTLQDFKTSGTKVDIPVVPSADWLPNADGNYTVTVAFQLNLVGNNFGPQQMEGFDYTLSDGPNEAAVNAAIQAHKSVQWTLKIADSVPASTRAIFLNALDEIRLSVVCKDPTSPNPTPAQAEQAGDPGSEE